MQVTRTYEYDCASGPPVASEARRWCRGELHELTPAIPGDVCHDVELVLGELVANAIRARCAHVTVTLVVADRRVEVAVADDAPGEPRLRRAGLADGHGRGLAIVDALAYDWGVVREPVGKHVWAVLSTI